MITTVTANPSLDRTMHVASFRRGSVHRASAELVEPSGKGVNVSVALHRADRATTAVLPSGGTAGGQIIDLLRDLGVPVRTVAMNGDVRSNISVIEDDGTTTKFNAVGPRVTPDDVAALVGAAQDASAPGQWVAWCGSLPTGFTGDALAAAVAAGRSSGRRIALDSSGDALAHVLAGTADALPHLIKPNAEELAELVGRPLSTVGEVVDAAAALVARGVDTVLVSLGADGAVLVDDEAAWFGRSRVARVVNTAGAGDAFLAGYLAVVDGPARDRLASALRFGASAVQLAGTLLTHVDVDVEVIVTDVDPARDRPLGA